MGMLSGGDSVGCGYGRHSRLIVGGVIVGAGTSGIIGAVAGGVIGGLLTWLFEEILELILDGIADRLGTWSTK